VGRPQPAGDAVDQPDDHGVDGLGRSSRAAERALRADRAAPPADVHRAGVAVVGEGVQVPARGQPEQGDQGVLGELGDLATPTVIGRPTRSRTSLRRRAAISVGGPEIRRSPPTSRKASSIDSPSTSGVVCLNTSKTALLASE
jgi:hypothetical protein